MRVAYPLLLLLLLLLVGIEGAQAQRIVFSGQITESGTAKVVPFASVFVPGTAQGATADVEGRYQLIVNGPVDSLAASAIGFATLKKRVSAEDRQTVNFTLGAGSVSLGEVVVRPRENPAT
ncbi:carboxypeptidase-like regulatory domain-containing protein [Hymenobacter sp. AT01-02]|uniref:carboxypeptidase-like regulatory domain-containing protein n=1 Tax=Hymenobacter sp. AT01-02 TaxID=1571877 RepID=UPI0006985487|nr:carboxypeptidase-like regulatory domain-containing protein [Hymenobacter sp. AT01-02]